MAFKKIPLDYHPCAGGSALGVTTKKVPQNGRTQVTHVTDDIENIYNQDLDPGIFSLQTQLDSNVLLSEVNSVLLNSEPTAEQLHSMESKITPKTDE